MSSEKAAEKLTITVDIPILDRGKDLLGNPITDEKLEENTSYVLNLFLQSYCEYIGAPRLGPISANGKVIQA